MNHEKTPKRYQLSKEEQEFIQLMKEKNESVTPDKIDESTAFCTMYHFMHFLIVHFLRPVYSVSNKELLKENRENPQ
jgi:predicted metallo-beta-lactamase superfamily hydrolase